MKYCLKCEVELDETMEKCPLCGEISSTSAGGQNPCGEEPPVSPGKQDIRGQDELTKKQRLKLFWELSALILFSAIFVTLFIDLVSSQGITWSKYPVAICLALFLNATFLVFLNQRPFFCTVLSFLVFASLLLMFDIFTVNNRWSMKLGIPILAMLYGSVITVVFIAGLLKERGLNIIGLSILVVGLLNFGMEFIFDRFFTGKFIPGWSVYVVVSTFPVALLLLFVHYRMRKGRELKRLFHI